MPGGVELWERGGKCLFRKDKLQAYVFETTGQKGKKWVKCTIYRAENGYNTHLVKPGIICYNVRWWETPPMIYEEIH